MERSWVCQSPSWRKEWRTRGVEAVSDEPSDPLLRVGELGRPLLQPGPEPHGEHGLPGFVTKDEVDERTGPQDRALEASPLGGARARSAAGGA